MRRLVAIGVAALALTPTALAAAPPNPADVYADFAAHGRLTHVYPRALLQSIIDDASLNQYGDPLVMLRLRRAARLQLAGVLPTPITTTVTSTAGTTQAPTTSTSGMTTRPATTTATRTTNPPKVHSTPSGPVTETAGGALLSTRALVLIAVAFVLAVGALAVLSSRARRR